MNYRILVCFQISIDRNDMNKAFIQLTLEFLTKQVLISTWFYPTFSIKNDDFFMNHDRYILLHYA